MGKFNFKEELDCDYWEDVNVALDVLDEKLPKVIPNVSPGRWLYTFSFDGEWTAYIGYENRDSGIIEEEGKHPRHLAYAIWDAYDKLVTNNNLEGEI